jgi:hypothetical protein
VENKIYLETHKKQSLPDYLVGHIRINAEAELSILELMKRAPDKSKQEIASWLIIQAARITEVREVV